MSHPGLSPTWHRVEAPEQGADRDDAEGAGDDAHHAERAGFVWNQRVRALRERDVDRIPRRMRLVMRHVEVPHAEREVDRVEIFQGLREKGKVEREKYQRERHNRRRARRTRRKGFHTAGSAVSALIVFTPGAGTILRSNCPCGNPAGPG